MNTVWFKKWGWAYVPVNGMGFMVTLIAIIFLIPVYISIFQYGSSLPDNLYHMFLYTTCVAFWWKWVAEKTS